MFDSLDFPETPNFKAAWKAIYFEPIVNSGERIAILIVVKNKQSNEIKYFDALHDAVIDNLYGAQSLPFKNLVKYIKQSLKKNHGELNNCLEGVYESKWNNSTSSNINGVAQQGLRKAASLGTLAIQELMRDSTIDEDHKTLEWTAQVKNEFLKTHPGYKESFNKHLKIENVRIKCGFYTTAYSAKFNVCMPKTVNALKSSFSDLQTLNEQHLSKKFDLILFLNEENLQLTEKQRSMLYQNVEILQNRCKGTPIDIITCDGAKEGSKRMIEMLNVA